MRPEAGQFGTSPPQRPAGPASERRLPDRGETAFRHEPLARADGDPHRPPDSSAQRVRRRPRPDPRVEGNARLTATTAVVLLALFALEGLTLVRINSRSMLTAHVVVGMVLVPPVLVKVGSTSWRFVRYYTRHPA